MSNASAYLWLDLLVATVRRSQWAVSFVVTVALALGVLTGVPAEAQEVTDPAAPVVSAPAAGEELVSLRTRSSKTFATGTPEVFRSEVYSGPVHFLNGLGELQDIDLQLAPGPDGRLRTTANEVTVEFAPTASDPEVVRVVLAPGVSIGWGVDKAASVGSSSATQGSVVYQGVVTDTDLKLSPNALGVKEDLILRSRNAPNVFVFPLTLHGLTAELTIEGDIVYRDVAGDVRARTPKGWMQDSGGGADGEGAFGGVTYALTPLADGRTAIVMSLDALWLADLSRVFPVTVDPTTSASPPVAFPDDTFVQHPWTNDYSTHAELKAGTFNSGGDKARSFLHFDLTPWNGKQINWGYFGVWEKHSYSCSARTLNVQRVTTQWGGSTTRSYPGPSLDATPIGSVNVAKGYSASCPGDWVNVNIPDAIRRWVGAPGYSVWPNHGLALTTNESDNYYWKKFYSHNGGIGFSPTRLPHINFEYSDPNRPPNVPDSRTPSSGTLWAATPTLKARFTDPDGNNGRLLFRVRNSAGVQVAAGWNSDGDRASGTYGSWTPPALSDGAYTWTVQAMDHLGAYSDVSPAYSFTVDAVGPAAPSVASSTHPNQNGWYSSQAPSFSWSASDVSGINGYSYVLDQSPGTVPNDFSEGPGTSKSYSGVADGTHYFHVKARNAAGVWGQAAHYRIQIDSTPPPAPSVSSSTHPSQSVWYANDDPSFSWSASDLSGIAGYSYILDQSSSTVPDTLSEGGATSKSYTDVSDGVWWFHVRAVNGAGLWSGATAHYKIQVDDTPSAVTVSSPTHPIQTSWYSSRDPSFSWSASDTSGVNGYSYVLDQSSSTVPDTASEGTAESKSYSGVTDGVWYFHVRAQNGSGLWGDATHFKVQIDGTSPNPPSVSSSTHPDSTHWSRNNDPSFSWSAAALSGINGYSYALTGNAAATPDTTAEGDGSHTSKGFTDEVDGQRWFNIRARSGSGLWSGTASYGVRIDTIAPSTPATVASTHIPAVGSSDRTVDVTWSAGVDTLSGVAGYSWVFNQSNLTPADGTADGPASQLSATSGELADGLWYFHVRTLDAAGNISGDKVFGPIIIDPDSSPLPTSPTLGNDPEAQSDELGLEQFAAYDDVALGTADGYVQLRTGNFVAAYELANIPGQGLNTVVRATYNSQRAKVEHSQFDNGLGLGWTLSVGDIDAGVDEVDDLAEGSVTDVDLNGDLVGKSIWTLVNGVYAATGRLLEFTDGDGTVHRFIRKGGPGSRWDAPPGVSLRVFEDIDQVTGRATAYRLVRTDGVTYTAQPVDALAVHWRLTAVADRRGNTLTYAYGQVAGKTRLLSITHSRTANSPTVRFDYSSATGNLTRLVTLPDLTALDPASNTVRSFERWTDFDVDAQRTLRSISENTHPLPAGAVDGKRTTTFGYHPTTLALAEVKDARGFTTYLNHEAFDGRQRLTSVTDRRGKNWTWSYGVADATTGEQVTTATPPGSGATRYRTSQRGPVSATDRRIAGGNIVRITDAGTEAGKAVDTAYAWTQNRLTSVTDGELAVTQLRYNDLGLLTHVSEPAPNDPARTDLPAGAPKTTVDSTLQYSFPDSYRYGPSCTPPAATSEPVSVDGHCHAVAHLVRATFADNIATQRRITDFGHDAAGNVATVIERGKPDPAVASNAAPTADDRATTFSYYTTGALKSVDGPRGDVADVTTYGNVADLAAGGYDRTGMPQQLVDALGKTKTFTYTPYGAVSQVTDRDARVTKSRYDERDNLVEVTDPAGRVTAYRYDANDNKTHETSPRGTATSTVDDFTTITTYDNNGWATQVSEPGENASTPRRIRTTSYNDDGTVASETTPLGAVATTRYAYWPNRLTKSETAPAGTGQTAVTEYFYDRAGRVILTRYPAVNAGGQRPATETNYTPDGGVAAVKETSPSGIRDRVTRHAYNAHGETLSVVGPRAVSGTHAETANTYDAFGQLTQSQRRLTSTKWLSSTFSYDPAGNQIRAVQPSGNNSSLESLYRYDAVNQLQAQTKDPFNPGHQVVYEHSGEGQQTKRVDQRTNGTSLRTTVYEYNADNTRRAQVTTDHQTGQTIATCNWSAGATDRASGYDLDGNLLTTRTVTGTQGCEAGTTVRQQTFTYDQRGWITATVQRVVSPRNGATYTRNQSFTYNADGTRASATHAGRTTTYTHSPAGLMESTTDWRGVVSSVSYHPSGEVATQALGGTRASGSFAYHPDGTLSALSWSRGSDNRVVRSHTGVAYEGGLRTGETVTVLRPDTTTQQGTASFTHDLADRLVSWTSPFPYSATDPGRPTTTYTLDDGSNITTETVTVDGGLRRQTDSVYADGKLSSQDTNIPSVGLTIGRRYTEAFIYSLLGEETSRTTTEQPLTNPDPDTGGQGEATTTTTTYDPAGQVKAVNDQAAAGTDVDYVYDSSGRVISRTERPAVGGTITRLYFYWGASDQLAEEATGGGATVVRYVADDGHEAIAQESFTPNEDAVLDDTAAIDPGSGTWTWLLGDAAGNVATLLADDGAVTEQAAYDPYGRDDPGGTSRTTQPGAPKSTLKFQGAHTDATTGNVLLGGRQYDPTTNRFTTPDSYIAGELDLELATDNLTGNRYLFAGANPTAYYEDGHRPGLWGSLRRLAKAAIPYIPVVGTAYDLVTAATGRDFLDGGRKLSGAERMARVAFAAASMLPAGAALRAGAKAAVRIANAAKVVEKAKTGNSVGRALGVLRKRGAATCAVANSFIAGTPILLADGTTKPIEDINIGDQVAATDPETGDTSGKPVTWLIEGSGDKNLVAISLTDATTITATDGHPFYLADVDTFVDAEELQPGDLLRLPDGATTTIRHTRHYTTHTTVYNFTVADYHTYYAGASPTLVHNINVGACPVGTYIKVRSGKDIDGLEVVGSGRPMNRKSAIQAALRGGDIYTPLRSDAKWLAKKVKGGRGRGLLDEIDKPGPKLRYSHFQVRDQKGHIFYGKGRRGGRME